MQVSSSLYPEEKIPVKYLQEVLWRRGDLQFLLWDQQLPIWEAMDGMPPHIVEFVVLCARQFGKSTLGVLRALSRAIKQRDCCILIMGPDTKQIKDIVRPKMRFLTQTAPKGLIKQMKSENRFHIYHDLNPNASDYTEIILGGMNENSSSQRGKTVQDIFVEEIGDQNGDNFVESMDSDLGPAMTHSKNGKITYLTTVPPIPDHPFITDVMVRAEQNNAIKIYTIDDNKALTQQQYDNCVTRSGGKHTTAFKREYLCMVVRDQSLVVLPDWTVANISEVLLPDHMFMHVTIDWGGVKDKTCAVLHYYDYLKDTDVFWDERVWEPNTPSSVIIEGAKEMEAEFLKIRDTHKIESRFIDAPYQFVRVDLLQEPYCYEASVPTKPDWKASVNILNNRFKTGKALIHPRCQFLILSARSGMLNKTKTDFDRSQALGHCDGIAAMMYAVRMRDTADPYPKDPWGISRAHDGHRIELGDKVAVQSINLAPQPKRFGRHR